MPQGTIKKVVADRGFGFISGGEQNDIFFHSTSVQEFPFDQLWEGQAVEYEIEDAPPRGGKGPRALSVKPAS
jgi:CspA family cold shock protein